MTEKEKLYTQFIHYARKKRAISLKKLDELADFVINSGPGLKGAIIAGLKMGFITVYLISRKNIIDEEKECDKQRYEQDQDFLNEDEIGQEDMDGL